MNTTQQGDPTGNAQELEQSPFRRYGWILAVMALLLVLLCAGIGMSEAAGGPHSILARLRGSLGQDGGAPTLIPAQDRPTSTASPTPPPTASETPPASDTPTATTAPAIQVTCRCKGDDYICTNGVVKRNSPNCAPVATPVCACKKHDLVCSNGARSVNDLRCGLACWCQGNDLYCNDGTVGIYNPRCACTCSGTTMICNDGGSQRNAPFCTPK